MTQEEILEYNKMCVEFLEWKKVFVDNDEPLMYIVPKNFAWTEFYNLSDEFEALTIEQLQFHSDWNWIMEVVESIEKIDNVFVKIHTGGVFIHPINDTKNYISKQYNSSKKEAVIQAINQFLIWYNENRNFQV